ncbi:MAG: hypothetical protein COB84_09060 [Rhodobacteraceae bacterium]|nr:MAG: hypothetical protein COB84_09060 [Paracoccaceae bacterium]
MRSMSAAARRMEKDAQRRHKQAIKEQTSANTTADVQSWENYINDLLTVHVDLTDKIDWERFLKKPEPKKPKLLSHHKAKAQTGLSSFKPSIFDFLKGGRTKILKSLDDALSHASELDALDHQKAMKTYTKKLADWKTDRSLAKRLTDGKSSAIQEVITEMQTLSKNDLIGSAVQFSINDNYVHAKPQVHADNIVPSYRRKQLASGKLSETKMPIGQLNELYQDYVASVALKVAGDLFQILPLNEVFVTCESNMLNSATGHKEPTPILSVQFVRETMMQLNLTSIDPSDSMSNFNHIMKFSKTKGFSPVKPLKDDA